MSSESPQEELLQWHYRLGNFLFTQLQLLSALGVLPRKLLKVNPPKCAGCLYGAMKKRSWRTKSTNNRGSIREASAPGECISVDHVESSTPGFIAQLKGNTNKHICRTETIFLDQCSDMTYVHLQIELSSEEIVEAKKAFDAYTRAYKVKIKHYHTDNGRFTDNAFLQVVTEESQTMTYCGVNAYFQNGKAENRKRYLQDQTRKQLQHAKSRWPSAVKLALWPYAPRQATHLRNCLQDKEDASSLLERFSRISIAPKFR